MSATSPASTPEVPVSITLSAEEVYVLLRLLRGKAMPGLDFAAFELDANGNPSERARRVLASATNSLIARGVVQPDNLRRERTAMSQTNVVAPDLVLKLPPDAVALVGTCAFGEYTLRLALLSASGMVNVYLHQLRQVGVLHTMPLADIHKFTGLRGRQGVLDEVSRLLGLEAQPNAGFTPFTVPESTLYAARDAAIGGRRDDAIRLLLGTGLPASVAQELAGAMANPRGLGVAAVAFRAADRTPQERQFAFVIGQQTCFLLTPRGSSPDVYDVQSASVQQVLQHFRASLPM